MTAYITHASRNNTTPTQKRERKNLIFGTRDVQGVQKNVFFVVVNDTQ